ncbi:hypothetical protein PRIPAC_82191 [Pristionchus pacificus]|uniref:Uncharacterized protein n=1 Tax=Pristionchus pacificus TaxID=54126 RepID=A0A2A6BXG5_PRIPA|nr:hypothetical protein PRIPAC_82191 [Pristionchus pacificus]|eukprot:PDM70578.1 hypothetical protein PRIPAC_46824 [Pristionchus pacificus]
MSQEYIKQVTVTGDLSSLARNVTDMPAWCEEVAKEIWEQKPELGVLHVQVSGVAAAAAGAAKLGLHIAEDPYAFAEDILRRIARHPKITEHFEGSRAFFDTNITGLGSLFLFRNVDTVNYFDRFSNTGYIPVRRGDAHVIGRDEADGYIGQPFEREQSNHSMGERVRDFFRHDGSRDLDNQRSGWLLARFRFHGKEMTFINLNLHSVPFEDVNEIVSQPNVTKAAAKRQRQIDALLHELDSEGLRDDAIIVAGAFNAQLHETRLLNDLSSTQRTSVHSRTDERGNVDQIEQTDRHGQKTVTVEEHRFDLHSIHDWFFRLGRGQMVKKYNGELAQVAFQGRLLEESVFFQPSRHYGINKSNGKEEFLRHLCPAWGDRVLYNERMSDLFRHDSFCASGLYYGIVGENRPIGEWLLGGTLRARRHAHAAKASKRRDDHADLILRLKVLFELKTPESWRESLAANITSLTARCQQWEAPRWMPFRAVNWIINTYWARLPVERNPNILAAHDTEKIPPNSAKGSLLAAPSRRTAAHAAALCLQCAARLVRLCLRVIDQHCTTSEYSVCAMRRLANCMRYGVMERFPSPLVSTIIDHEHALPYIFEGIRCAVGRLHRSLSYLLSDVLEAASPEDRVTLVTRHYTQLRQAFHLMNGRDLVSFMAYPEFAGIVVTTPSLLRLIYLRARHDCRVHEDDCWRKFEYDDYCQTATLVMDSALSDDKRLQEILGYGYLSVAGHFASGRFDMDSRRTETFRRILSAHPEWRRRFKQMTCHGVEGNLTADLGRTIPDKKLRPGIYYIWEEGYY